MSSANPTIRIATRGSALALAQANMVLAQCQAAFPETRFEIKIIKTTGDKLQTASLAQEGKVLPKGLFTKELEVALLEGRADLAVHSLKDLPTELPTGLALGAVGKRADVRDVLIYRQTDFVESLANKPAVSAAPSPKAPPRGFHPNLAIQELPDGAVVATSSTRRRAQLLAHHPRLKVPDIRGNVATRLQKLADNPDLDATLLALAGLSRLGFHIGSGGALQGKDIPNGLLATILDPEVMLPCVGQGAIGIEIREKDGRLLPVCERLNDPNTFQCVTAERAFLSAMGGGCQSPVAAFAEVAGATLQMRALSFVAGPLRRARASGPLQDAAGLGARLAAELKG
jgi:hydroxymethylbilane synthase